MACRRQRAAGRLTPPSPCIDHWKGGPGPALLLKVQSSPPSGARTTLPTTRSSLAAASESHTSPPATACLSSRKGRRRRARLRPPRQATRHRRTYIPICATSRRSAPAPDQLAAQALIIGSGPTRAGSTSHRVIAENRKSELLKLDPVSPAREPCGGPIAPHRCRGCAQRASAGMSRDDLGPVRFAA